MPKDSQPSTPLRFATRPVEVGVERARDLRKDSSPPEHVLWKSLRGGRLGGHKFRRQHPLGPWVVDFYSHDAKLVIELDGESFHHGEQLDRDNRKDAWLAQHNYTIVRISVSDLMKNKQGVLEHIQRTIEEKK